jgi:hypothetical protein
VNERYTRRFLSARAIAVSALVALSPSSAFANGRMPGANQLVVDPNNEKRLVLRTTYGLTISVDGGATWEWICEAAMGYGEVIEDPPVALTADGTLLVGTSAGMRISRNGGCDWTTPDGPIGISPVTDVALARSDPSRGVAVITYIDDGGVSVLQLYATADNGGTWTLVSAIPSNWTYVSTVDVAPSNPDRVYVAGSGGKPVDGLFGRSDDGGKSWKTTSLGTGYDILYIGAIAPDDPDRVYARLDSDPSNRFFLSTDGGSFREVFHIDQKMLGFALSRDGATIALGGPAGLWLGGLSDPTTLPKVNSFGPACLAWSSATLYACADESVAGFELGVSNDRGASVQPLFRLSDVKQSSCAASSMTGSICPAYWPPGKAPSARGGLDDASVVSNAEADASADAAPGSAGKASGDSSGCGCRLPSGKSAGLPIGMSVLACARALRRRLSARRKPRTTH